MEEGSDSNKLKKTSTGIGGNTIACVMAGLGKSAGGEINLSLPQRPNWQMWSLDCASGCKALCIAGLVEAKEQSRMISATALPRATRAKPARGLLIIAGK